MASHGEFRVVLPWFPINLIGLAGIHIFSKMRGEAFRNGADVVGFNKFIEEPTSPSQLVHG